MPGARVCPLDATTNCEETDPDGVVTIEVPVGESGYTVEKEGYASYLYPDIVPLGGYAALLPLPTAARMSAQHGRVGSPYPPRLTGSILILTSPARAGVTFELAQATNKPFYVEELTGPDDEVTDWSLDLTETTSEGKGGFSEVSPGAFLISLGGTASGCIAALAWPAEGKNTIRLPVREGYITRATVTCAAAPP